MSCKAQISENIVYRYAIFHLQRPVNGRPASHRISFNVRVFHYDVPTMNDGGVSAWIVVESLENSLRMLKWHRQPSRAEQVF